MRLPGSSFLTAVLLLMTTACGLAGTHFETAEQRLLAGEETDARRALELELASRPGNLEARYNLAVLLERIGHESEAAKLYRENMERGRHLPSVVNLSALMRTQGHIKEARTLLQQATKEFHDEAVPWYLLAEMAENAGNKKQACDNYQLALKADEKNAFANLRFARFLSSTGQLDAAVAQAGKAVDRLPSCASCLHMAGDIYAKAGKDADALALWQRSIAIKPDKALRQKILRAIQARAKTRP